MNVQETTQFRAVAGNEQGFGVTPQEALTALMSRLTDATTTPIVIWPFNRANVFFTDEQQARLQELKSRHDTLTEAERAEWEQLVEASFDATIARTRLMPVEVLDPL